MKLIIQLIIKNLISFWSIFKNLTKIIKTNNIKSLLYKNKIYNLTYKYLSILFISNLINKIIIILLYILILSMYFYILYIIHTKAYNDYIIKMMINIKIDLFLLYIKELLNVVESTTVGEPINLNLYDSIILNLHWVNNLNYDSIINNNWYSPYYNINLFYSIHNIQNYHEILSLYTTNSDLMTFNNLIKNDISPYALKLNFQSMMVQEIITTHLETLSKLNQQSFRLFILTSPFLIILLSVLYLDKIIFIVQV